MKWIMNKESIVGLNETNAGARETFFEVLRDTPNTYGKFVARAPTMAQAQKLMANAQRERIAKIKKNSSHHPLVNNVFFIVKVKRSGHHDGQQIAQVYAEDEYLTQDYRFA